MREQTNDQSAVGRAVTTLAAWLLLAFCALGVAQTAPGVGVAVDFPEVGSLEISAMNVEFDLSGEQYPPLTFPAYYQPVGPGSEDEPIVLTVTTNSSSWRLEAAFTGLIRYDGSLQFELPIDQLEYRVDAGPWLSFSAPNTPTTLVLTPGPSDDTLAAPESYNLELRLKVTGNETPGSYEGTLTFTLTSQ